MLPPVRIEPGTSDSKSNYLNSMVILTKPFQNQVQKSSGAWTEI